MSDLDRFDLQGAVDRGELSANELEARKVSAHKLVDAFAGITNKRLHLREGAPARTDGHDITVPLGAPDAYKQLEHRLAHILFQTDTLAKATFIEEYVRIAAGQVAKQGSPLDDGQLRALASLLSEILSVIECHRVESLWSLLYSGSYQWGRKEARAAAALKDEYAHEAIGTFLSILETGHNPPPGGLDRFKPYCIEALRKSELRGYNATLIVTKWLLSHLVSEMIEESKSAPPPPEALPLPDLGNEQLEQETEAEQGEPQLGEDGESTGNTQTPDDDAEAKKGDLKGEGKDSQKNPVDDSEKDGPGSGKWTPKKSDASAGDRAKALKDLLKRSGHQDPRRKPPVEDTSAPKASSKSDVEKSTKAVSEALRADTFDSKALERALDGSKRDMLNEVEKARDPDSHRLRHDDWLRKGADAKVVFRDVRRTDVIRPGPMLPEDVLVVQRLRALFNRVLGRRRFRLEETGDTIDTEAYIARVAFQQHDVPVMRQTVRGRGFKFMLLIDRSGSMADHKTAQAERACRILSRALRYPFVQLHIWGFQSLAPGQIDLVRFDPKVESFTSDKSALGGQTPLHLAMSVANRFMGEGNEVKQILAVTDGFPVYNRKDGKGFPTRQLILETHEEVAKARARGVVVTGAIIGNKPLFPPDSDVVYDLGPKELRFIFGRDKNWRQVHPASLGSDLVRLATNGFLGFLGGA